ncbi:MAG: choice-of-anchor K domain-containing protein [Rubritepida sp.]|jgi:hypothetical protein|nr:choice-of-anchor K domain-containing protein [Rubritepida sp.]
MRPRTLTALMTSLVLSGSILAGVAQAAPLVGNSNGSFFSGVSGCGLVPCSITGNGGQGANSRVEWGTTVLADPNTLTARDTSFSATVPANDVVIAALRWANPIQAVSPTSFNVNYNLVLDFITPPGSASVVVPLEIRGPIGADIALGLTVSSLAGLSYTLPGLTISDLKFVLDTTNSTLGTTFNAGTGRWALPETGASTLLITADFAFGNGGGGGAEVGIPAPGALALLGLGLIGLGALRRRG